MSQETSTSNTTKYVIAKPSKFATVFKYTVAIVMTILVLSASALYYLWKHEQKERAADRQDWSQQIQELKDRASEMQVKAFQGLKE